MTIEVDLPVRIPTARGTVFSRLVVPDWALTALLIAGVIGLCQALVSWDVVSKYVMPLPSSIPVSLSGLLRSGILFDNLVTTFLEAFAGFAIAAIVGLTLGALIAEFRLLERVLYPYVVALQTMPKIALAPVLVVWFGFGPGSKIAVAAVISLFPVLVNTIAGLKSCDAGRLDVLLALGAGRWDCFRLVRLPSALPFVFSGLSTASMFALTGAIVGEFVGANKGLGYLIVQANSQMDIPQVFAIVLVLAAIGTGAFSAVELARRKFLYWTSKED
jgi:NitT/TauT family transport system permease protein